MNPSRERQQPSSLDRRTVSQIMRQVEPIKGFENIQNVVAQLDIAYCEAAPVIDEVGHCVGILTMSDIKKYREATEQCEEGDLHALDATMEVDSFGTRRISIDSFDEVHRHMTRPVITIDAEKTVAQARDLFQENPHIHHLVVVDQCHRPVGVLELKDLNDADGQKDAPN